MIKLYPENFDVAIDVLFTDNNGDPLAVTTVTAHLYDGDDVEIEDFGSIPFTLADGKVTVTVPADLNVLGEGETSAARTLMVYLGNGTIVLPRIHSYIIEAESRLELLNNTFITLPAAEVLARENPRLTAWAAAADDKKIAALINAYTRLSRVQLRYLKERPEAEVATSVRPYDPTSERDSCDVVIKPGDWGTRFNKVDFLAMPYDFRKAVRTAQLIEANEVLTDNPFEARHRAGVISETVGESSIMLRGGKLELGVSIDALRALTGFVYYNVRLARG
ncbi:hypothetical protein EVB78_043 [Rhizobium phage RHph_N1_15]|nr:hypothetical protein EVB77_042 [Rhizobium phage RHph_N1_10]QIG69245.1 hypothetical protein EVB78_043 [Rhizobium phage RHph_N1_15]QIG75105.1 hypothetical protein EVC15_043 [Rhizobium phage RHph_N2_6]